LKKIAYFYRKTGKKSSFLILKKKNIQIRALFTAKTVNFTRIFPSFWEIGSRRSADSIISADYADYTD